MPALFSLAGEEIIPSQLTRGGWSDDAQHGGPPCGIMARAVEKVPTLEPMQVVRLTVDLTRPVPLEPLQIETEVVREGRRIQLVDVWLRAGTLELGRARALKIRIGDLDLPVPETDTMPTGPESMDRLTWRGHFGEVGDLERFHYDAVEIRTREGSFSKPGPGVSWFRLLVPVVDGEESSDFVRLATLADMANGNSQALDPTVHAFVNPDISLHVHRMPRGDWIGMRSVSYPQPQGIGIADTALYDLEGRIGRVVQSQYLELR
ncbi:MAG TPA: thioesterase family protein [Acidimicrobiia bacterium]|nr:thioesterase family protein [Acidimicrobiia bacterium]